MGQELRVMVTVVLYTIKVINKEDVEVCCFYL